MGEITPLQTSYFSLHLQKRQPTSHGANPGLTLSHLLCYPFCLMRKENYTSLKMLSLTSKHQHILVPVSGTIFYTLWYWLPTIGTTPYNLQPGFMTSGLGFLQGPQAQALEE